MRKFHISILLILSSLLILSACSQSNGIQNKSQGPTWQEQYDLGLRYLSEGNYEEAIIAFTAAIEIDPKQASTYVGRGNAYILSGETEENLTAAQADYETTIVLDETNAAAYMGLADVYICRGDYGKALEILRQGLDKTGGNQDVADKIAEIENSNESESKLESPQLPKTLLNSWYGDQYTLERYKVLTSEQLELLFPMIEAGLDGNIEELKRMSLSQDIENIGQEHFWSQMEDSSIIYFEFVYGIFLKLEYRSESGTAFRYYDGYTDMMEYYYGYTDNYLWNGPLTIKKEDIRDGSVYYTQILTGCVKDELWDGEYIKEDYPKERPTWIEYITFDNGVPLMIPDAYTNSGEAANGKLIHEGYTLYTFYDDSPKNWFGWACG